MYRSEETALEPILGGCRNSDRKSQYALYRLYFAYGMSVSIRYVDSEEEAKAVLNDGFLKVFLNIKSYDPALPFKPWFRRIVINTALNHIKKQKKFKMEVALDQAGQVQGPEEILSRIGYKDLIGMVQTLSTAYRAVFNLYVIDGFKHEEIAAKLGITVGTSKSNLTRARAKLQELVLTKLNVRHV